MSSPGEVQLRMDRHIDEQRAEDQQVGPVVNGVFDERRFDLPCDGEPSGSGVGLHEGQKEPGKDSRGSEPAVTQRTGDGGSGSN